MPGMKHKKYEKIFPEFVDILGTPWQISVRGYTEDPYFKQYNADGYCSNPEKLIVVCDASTDPMKEKENPYFVVESMKACLRHEIVHAFFYESGLGESSAANRGAWAINEEMVDWIGQQATKIHRAFEDTGSVRTMNPEAYTAWVKYKEKKEKELYPFMPVNFRPDPVPTEKKTREKHAL